jgi:hypothetical protein
MFGRKFMLLKKNIYSSYEGEKEEIKYENFSSEKLEDETFSFQKLLNR